MKRILLETSFSKMYMIIMIIITLLILGGYFSYAMFTVTKEKSNAISIVTGNLTYKLEVEENETNTLTIPANSRQDFIVTLSNPNNRIARFNFYYEGSLPDGVDIGYIEKEGVNTPPSSTGINLEKVDTTGSSNTYIVRVANTTESEISIELGVSVGLDYNDLELPDDGHLLRKITSTGTVSEVIEDDIMNKLNYEDEEQTFVTGSNPNNYVWYSGKLWRVVSIDPSDNSVKLVTQWNISTISYNTSGNSTFEGSYMEDWLNDTTVDGFLGNLRDYENFIVTESEWYDQETDGTVRPTGEPVIDAVGLLNYYEVTAGNGGNNITSYLNNELYWWTLTPYSLSSVYNIAPNGSMNNNSPSGNSHGVRPSINLKTSVHIIDGDGSEENPYRLEGDNDSNLSGTLLNTRYSGEYISFGTGENNLYRIVSHENETGTKITSAEPLKSSGEFITINFGSHATFSSTNVIGTFLNGEYLTDYIGENYSNMIEENTTWYLGIMGSGSSYILAKYSDTSMSKYATSTEAKVGLLRFGELMTGQFDRHTNNMQYWTLTRRSNSVINYLNNQCTMVFDFYDRTYGIKPALNLKSNVIITGGDGTKNNPFTIELG